MTIKMSRERMEAFARQNYNLIDVFEFKTDHDKLLREHIIDMHFRLQELLRRREQNNFSIKLSNAEAMAFYQVWQQVDLSHCPYSRVIVDDAVAKIDKYHKSNKTRNERIGY